MKLISRLSTVFLGLALSATTGLAYADTSLQFNGEQAKMLYDYLTGSAVQAEGAAGHSYRIGKTVTCRYTNVDVSDTQGHDIPQQDPRRYACSMKMDHEGFVSVNHNF